MSDYYKTWWRPLWAGLGIDPDGKHSKQMKTAVWLFLYLIMVADPRTGVVSRSYYEMSRETGRKKKTVKKWMAVLRKKGYVITGRRGEELFIRIRKWKSVGKASNRGSGESEAPLIGDYPGPQSGSFGKSQKVQKTLYSSRQSGQFENKDDTGMITLEKIYIKTLTLNVTLAADLFPEARKNCWQWTWPPD